MALTTGEHTLGPSSGRLLIKTGRAGLGRSVGHDLTIEVTRWSATATVADDPAGSSVTAEIETGSFEVVEGVGGVVRDRKRSDDREDACTEECVDEGRVAGGVAADVAEIFAAGSGNAGSAEQAGILAADAGGGGAEPGEVAHDALVERGAEDGFGDF